MLRRAPQVLDDHNDRKLMTGRALLIILTSASISLVVGGGAATLGWLGAINLANPTTSMLTAAAAGLSAATLTFLKAVDLLHQLIQ